MAVDPDPLGFAFIFPPGSGSAFNMRIRIQEGKYVKSKLKKFKDVANNFNCIKHILKSKLALAGLFQIFEQSFRFATT